MPTSVPYCLPIIASVARQIQPASVLDVGVGFGKYGCLFREYLDIWGVKSVDEYAKSHWRTRIDGIDATKEYITPLHRFIYDEIYVGDVLSIIGTLGRYDVIMMGDVLEHFEKDVGHKVLDELYEHTARCLILTFPSKCRIDLDVAGNPYEAHRSSWNRADFRRFEQVEYKLVEGYTALVALTKPPHLPPLLTPSFAARRRAGWKGVVANLMVRVLGPDNASRLATRLLGERVALRI